ncbi:MAG: isoleucine--tRNA ligase [Candidatus Melainabacteria bacterium HGW-Melainabacteria-1]|nr:MAG: isoleucine--tRNA ligase [Candidatus Melainabacteria bacterium HGW-Melainabacteria-1]
MDYKATLNLPQTSFSMRAGSAQREPEIQAFWKDQDIYRQNLTHRNGDPFILHDGPPYLSSGRIHIGHALNRILKDMVVKYQTLNNHPSPLVFGYDCHGLPIEHEVTKARKPVKEIQTEQSPLEIRQACAAFALENLKGQQDNFYRLGLMGDWEHPYLTMNPAYEAAQLRVFAEMVDKGYIYKGLKPVYWSIGAQTALAEAEVEYMDKTSHSIYVKFPLQTEEYSKLPEALQGKNVFFVIWTTTPWTLPANLGIALNPDFDYSFITADDGSVWVLADKLAESVFSATGQTPGQTLYQSKGNGLENLRCKHPFYERDSRVVLGNHVTTEAGTGCVHTAPGHGMEDFVVGDKYKLGVLSPVDAKGVFTAEAPGFEGLFYDKANQVIIDLLVEKGLLVHHSTLVHSYAHCWRTKTPLIYRATEQWFASVDGFRQAALAAVKNVSWHPASGQERISNMISDRTDWCISRQRVWGVPIPAFYAKDSGEVLLQKDIILHVADLVEQHGSNVWWEREAKDLLPAGFTSPKSQIQEFEKETDIMDVWFDSGTSHSGVLRARPELRFPANLYLEGSDQHRGWFQSSLLTSIAAYGEAPYKTVLTHGFVMDGQGRKMSKSLGNVVEPQKVIEKYGADVLRLWVASVDYSNDMRLSYDIVDQLAEIYKKIRNTIRFLISNLYDFDPEHDELPHAQLSELDRFTLHKLQDVVGQVRNSFDSFAFYRFYQIIQNFCVIDLSNIYFAIVKDILYIEAPNSPLRRSVQTVLWEVLQALLGMVTPVLSHLAEDAYQHLPPPLRAQVPQSALLANYPQVRDQWQNAKLASKWAQILSIRDAANLQLEAMRASKEIGRSMEAQAAVYHPDSEMRDYLRAHQDLFRQVLIVGRLEVSDAPLTEHDGLQTHMTVIADGSKCSRCWNTDPTVGQNPAYADLCQRCEGIVSSLQPA